MNAALDQGNLIELTAEIVSAYVSNNSLASGDIPGLIGNVHAALNRSAGTPEPVQTEPLRPAISPRKSITPDYIICLEDGKHVDLSQEFLFCDPEEGRVAGILIRTATPLQRAGTQGAAMTVRVSRTNTGPRMVIDQMR